MSASGCSNRMSSSQESGKTLTCLPTCLWSRLRGGARKTDCEYRGNGQLAKSEQTTTHVCIELRRPAALSPHSALVIASTRRTFSGVLWQIGNRPADTTCKERRKEGVDWYTRLKLFRWLRSTHHDVLEAIVEFVARTSWVLVTDLFQHRKPLIA